MSARTGDAAGGLKRNEARVDHLLGRRVLGRNNQSIGRIEEFRAARRGPECIVTEYVIGGAGLLERLGVGVKLLLGRHAGSRYVARWDQLDITDPKRPRLKCSTEELLRNSSGGARDAH